MAAFFVVQKSLEEADTMTKKETQLMSQEALELKRDYQRNWRKNNPDKVREHNRNYWEKRVKKLERVSNV